MLKLLTASLLISLSAHANLCTSITPPESDHYKYTNKIRIQSQDGTVIAANLLTPNSITSQKFPTIIFVNSWAMEEHEYLKQAMQFAKEGFQVLSYSARGWGCSTGIIDVIGDGDMNDIHAIVDWLISHTEADANNLGMAGISYGAGMTLKALALEPRLKTGVAMSAWGSLLDSLYGNNTPRAFWGSFLVLTGYLTGNMDNHILKLFTNLVQQKNIPEVKVWANARSPIQFIDQINKRNTPVYISNNFGDNLFQPNHVVDFFNQLTGPKQLDLNQGTHATGEIPGLFTASNHTFKKTHAWFNYWLQNKRTADFEIDKINVGFNRNKDHVSLDLNTLSSPKYKTFYLQSRSIFRSGRLLDSKAKLDNDSKITDVDWISSGRDTWATTGIPVLSEILSGHLNLPVFKYEGLNTSINGIDFVSAATEEDSVLFGAPKLRLKADSNQGNILIMAYLYDVGPFGLATLITHGAYTRVNKLESEIKFDMVTSYHRLPAGHRLALSIDTEDSLYSRPTGSLHWISFPMNNRDSAFLEIPEL